MPQLRRRATRPGFYCRASQCRHLRSQPHSLAPHCCIQPLSPIRSSAAARDGHTPILLLKPAAERAILTAAAMPPALAIWLSFSITICDRSIRWVSAPPVTTHKTFPGRIRSSAPTSMPYFSTRRKPGVVFRVPAIAPE